MKVKDLIAELECFDEDAEVHFSYTSGDYWRTELAPKVRTVMNGCVQYTTYHQGDKIVYPDDMEDAEDEEFPVRKVVVIE
jgi:hypothetical protein